MNRYLATVASVVAFMQPAVAVTFPSLTTIYVASGVYDDGGANDAGFATTVHCSNVSGQVAQVRFLILNTFGAVVSSSQHTVSHGNTDTASTHATGFSEFNMNTGPVLQGVLNVESTQSGVFCSAMIVEAAPGRVYGIPLHLVRVNPHPGTVE